MDRLQDVVEQLRLADILDIGVVTVLFYLAFVGLTRARSRLVLGLVMGVCGLYVLASALGMTMTTAVFEAGFVLFLVAMIVIFHDELRQIFHGVTSWRPFRRRERLVPTFADELAHSCGSMADRLIGALVVLEGRQSVEAYLTGGIELGGQMSDRLLRSLFNPASPGHDGAVVLRGSRVERFAAHLPLSRRGSSAEDIGTRHAAALGLSERTDALVIVVSEERGEMSVAYGGRLERGLCTAELAERIAEFRETGSPSRPRPRTSMLARAVGLPLSALVAAAGLWTLTELEAELVQRTMRLPIEYRNLDASARILDPKPRRAEVTLSGTEGAFARLDRDVLTVSVDMNNLLEGRHHILLDHADLPNLPAGIELYEVRPRHLDVRVEAMREVTLPVQVATLGKPKQPLSLEVTPAVLRVQVPATKSVPGRAISTPPVRVDQLSPGETIETIAVLPTGARLAEGESGELVVTCKPKRPA